MKLDPALRDQILSAVPSLRAFAISLSGNVDRADDLVQETMLRALANIHSFQPGTNMNAWLFTILRNLFRSEYRKRKREVEDTDGTYAEQLKSHPEQLGRIEFEELITTASWALRGRSISDLDEIGERLFIQKIAKRIYPEMRELVRAHQARGHTVVLSSSALTIQVEPVARFLGITNTLTNAFVTDENGVLTGEVVEPILWGPGKAAAVQKFAADHDIEALAGGGGPEQRAVCFRALWVELKFLVEARLDERCEVKQSGNRVGVRHAVFGSKQTGGEVAAGRVAAHGDRDVKRVVERETGAPHLADACRYDNCTTYAKLAQEVGRTNRYSGLNMTNLANRERMTVEWRIHQGTTDWTKIKAWVLATQRWVEHAVTRNCHFRDHEMPNTRAGINALLVTTGLKGNSRIYSKVDKELRQVGKYLLRRWKQFNLPEDRKSRSQPKAAVAAA